MRMSGSSVAVLAALGALWMASGTEREHAVLSAHDSAAIGVLEAKAAARPADPQATRELGQAYLDAHAPGLAVTLIQRAPAPVQGDARVQHVFARALLDQGRAEEALAAEHRVLDACAADGACDTWLVASATRRSDILRALVALGVEDAQAHPEASAIAYQNATREARLSVVE